LLAQISRAVEGAGRETDRVYRYGGDEFAVILPGTDATSALGVAERVRAAIHDLGGPGTSWSMAGLSITVSIGVATFPRDGATAEAILLAADRACFVAKRTGNGLIATADEGLAIARDFAFKEPTPIDAVQPTNGAESADAGTGFMGEPMAVAGRPAEPDPGPPGVTLQLSPAPDASPAT
jgi:hypothetical protein